MLGYYNATDACPTLQTEDVNAIGFGPQLEDGHDIGVIERRGRTGFSLKSLHIQFAVGKFAGKNFYRQFASQPRVARAINFTHPAGAQCAEDFVVAKS